MAVATLSIDLEARLARLEGDLNRATRSIEREAGRMEKAFVGASGAIKNVVGLLGTGVAATWLTTLARDTIAGIDALNDLSDSTGSSIENLSALEDAAARTGTRLDTVGSTIIKLNQQLAATDRPGSQAAAIFDQLGLNAEELKRIDPAEALLRTAQALQGFADDGNKARLIQALFGKSVAEVAPLLKDLAEQGKLNASVTQDQADQVDRFNKAMAVLTKNFADLSREVVGASLPAVNNLVGAFKDGGRYVFEMSEGAAALAVPLQALTVLGANVAYVFRETGREIGAVAAQGAALASFDFSRAAAIRIDRLADAAAARQALDDFEARVLRLNQLPVADYSNEGRSAFARPSLGPVGGGGGAGGGRGGRPAAAGRSDIFGPAVPDAVADAIRRIEGSDETKLQRLRDTLQQLGAIVSGGGSVPGSTFASIADEITRLDPAAQAAGERLKELTANVSESQRIMDATRTPAESLARELANLQRLLDLGKESGGIDFDTYARAQFEAQERFDAATKNTDQAAKDLDNTARDLGLTFSSAFENAIVDGEKFGDVLKSLEKDILRIATRKIITEPLADGITGLLGKGGAGGGDFFSNLISKAGSLFEGFFAEGGFIPPGRWGIAGERGPEPVFGGRTGATVQPAGGMTVVQTFNLSGPVDRRTQQQIAAAAARGIQQANTRTN
jgi:hypothetical protein